MEYREVRIVAELRKQGEHERAEEFRLKAMRRIRRRLREQRVPSAGIPRTPPPLQIAARYAREGLDGEPVPQHGRRIGRGPIPHHIRTTKEVGSDDTYAGGGIRPPRRGARRGRS